MTTITVINSSDSGAGSLRAALAAASAGDIINFAPSVTTIDLDSSLVISTNVTIEGAQTPGTPGVTINGGGAGSNFSDFTIAAGVIATFDGLVIADGNATGTAGSPNGPGGGAAGGIYDAGALTLTNSVLQNDTATGGAGGHLPSLQPGGAGGTAAGGIYVGATGSLTLAASDSFSNDSAVGGAGGQGGASTFGISGGGAGGAGGVSGVNGGLGASGQPGGGGKYGGAGGAPGRAGSQGHNYGAGNTGAAGGGGGGAAFADVAGAGRATLIVTNNSDDINTVGSLRHELALAGSGDTIIFAPSVTTIDLASTLTIAKNVTIEGAQTPGTPGVTIVGGGSGSNFSDFTIAAGVSATFDGLVIADGNATGVASNYFKMAGGGAAGGVYDAGSLTLTNSVLQDDTATGGAGSHLLSIVPGGAGGTAAGGIYVGATGSLTLAASDSFSTDSAVGGAGGQGGESTFGLSAGGAGGAGGLSGVNGGLGASGQPGGGKYGGAGGAPGQAGSQGHNYGAGNTGASGGGGGGAAFADVAGAGRATLVVTNNSDDINTIGSLRYELALAATSGGNTITFAPAVTTIDLTSTLTIAKNVTIEGAQTPGTPGVTIVGGGSGSNFSDFTIAAGVSATFDGLVIADGNATGTAGSSNGPGGGAAGGIYDAGSLTLTNSVLQNDTATGGAGGGDAIYQGGGAGGTAAGGIYIAGTGSLDLGSGVTFNYDSAVGGAGGQGGAGFGGSGGTGGAGGVSGINGGIGSPGTAGAGAGGGAGGAPGQAGSPGAHTLFGTFGSGGGGGGGAAFAGISGAGKAALLVTNSSDNVNTAGSLRYELALATSGDTITFASSVTTIDLASTLTIAKNVVLEGAQTPGTPGVTIVGGGNGSDFSDFTIDAGISATFDGLIIADGFATGTTGGYGGGTGGTGGGGAGGIFDAGALTLTNSLLRDDMAAGGTGGRGAFYQGGGAGGEAAGGIYVAATGSLNLGNGNSFQSDFAVGGTGGQGGYSRDGSGGAGGFGGTAGSNGGLGFSGQPGGGGLGGAGGTPGHAGSPGIHLGPLIGPGGGGGGGTAFADVGGVGGITGQIPCYCPGTLIETPRGETRVETLKIGDKVTTASGAVRPIKWIGRRSYGGRFIRGDKGILPICIKAGALDDNVPKRDLWISPHHAMYLDGALIEAKDLVNGVSIVQAERVEKVEYFHIELQSHDVIIAEGALAESFIDDDSRVMFHNAHDYDTLYADGAAPVATHYCAPRLEEGYQVEEVRRRIAARAGLLHIAGGEPLGSLRGHIDEASVKRIAGWAQNPDHPGAPVCLDIFAEGLMIGQVLANAYRADLWRAGIGSGHHAFTFVPPQGIALESVEVRRSLDGAVLAHGPNADELEKMQRRA